MVASAGVLIVDDRPDNLTALEASLAPLDVRITRAGSGAEALRSLLVEDFAVILLDVQMPDLDGFETARLIKERSRTRHIPIIFLTAISREIEHQLKGYSAGAVDYLAKPFDPEVLRSKVAVFVELYDQSRLISDQNALLAERLDERDRAEAALSRHAAELQRSNAALDRLASAASADLLAPLHVLAGMLELVELRSGGSLDADGTLLMERARRRALELAEQVELMLGDARESVEPPRRDPTDLNQALDRARRELAPLLGSDVVLTADPLPTVAGDEWQLVQVFVHLLTHAVRSAAPDHPEVHVALSRRRSDWLVSVADNGPGLAPGEQAAMFDGAHGDAGLAVARRIVERHGGAVLVDAVLGRGTTVSFTLAVDE